MAEQVFRLLCCTLVVVFCLIDRAYGVDIDATTCDPTDADSTTGGTAVCTALDANADCRASETLCSCNDNYLLTTDKTTCNKAITAITCNPASDGLATCQAEDANAECATDKCICKSGYEQNSESETACLKTIGKACTTNADCSNDDNAECSSSTCQCMTGYIGKNDVCTKVIDTTTCNPASGGTATCNAVDANSDCRAGETVCSCNDDYLLTTDKTACTQVIDTITCNPASGGTATCTAVDANSDCRAGETVCSCKDDYLLTTDKTACTKAITAIVCDPASGGLATCQAEDANAVCASGATACSCKSGYEPNPDSETACQDSSGQTAFLSVGLLLASLLVVFQNSL